MSEMTAAKRQPMRARQGRGILLSLEPRSSYTLPSRKAKVEVTFGPPVSAAPALEPEVLVRVLGCAGAVRSQGSSRGLEPTYAPSSSPSVMSGQPAPFGLSSCRTFSFLRPGEAASRECSQAPGPWEGPGREGQEMAGL